MKIATVDGAVLTCSIVLFLCLSLNNSLDTITVDKPLRDSDGELLLSKSQKFALRFFSPGKSNNRYVGISYNFADKTTVVWVANRDDPLNDTSGVLSIIPEKNQLVLHRNYNDTPIWSTDASAIIPNSNTGVIAQLTDLANLVLIRNDTKAVVWQSFDHPTDTLLPYATLGFSRRTGQRWILQSWKSEDDPGRGSIIYNFSSDGKPQMFIYKQNLPWWRGGSFNGEIFMGMPFMRRAIVDTFNITFMESDYGAMLSYNMFDKSIVIRVVIHQEGYIEALNWDFQKRQWQRYFSAPQGQCDDYGICGSNSNCDPYNYANFQCSCLPGFEPRKPHEWYQYRNADGGCVRKKGKPICGNNGEGFVKVEGVKIPDTSTAIEKRGLSLQECSEECLRNCSCMAYALSDVKNGNGCLKWYGSLKDTQKYTEQGQDLYVKVDAIELANYAKKSKRLSKREIVAIPLVFVVAILLIIAIVCIYCSWKRERKERMKAYLTQDYPTEEGHGESKPHPNLLFFSFKTIMAATNNFSCENQLGQGGFGSVYKGQLVNGPEIAVKRLSKGSGQGTLEFKNEVKLIAKLQHRNLVRLLGCCVHKEERMLIYEYLPNKSLDSFIFDLFRRSSLSWDTRFEIILGIARGVLYLHQDSRLKIIHRDLKASNVLLDAAMNPKISDFGMARIFGEDDIQAKTKRVVGTYGYMSPEYAMEGRYSTKSDVFSFGVLMLEIISGKRNTDHLKGSSSVNLIGHIWDLWKEGKALDIVDSTLDQSFPDSVVLRCVQIGLLCVQESAVNRPSMLEVVFMLGNETTVPPPQKPAFIPIANVDLPVSSTSGGGSSVNDVTVTTISAR